MSNFKILALIAAVSVGIPLICGKAVNAREERISDGNYDLENNHRYHVAILKVLEDDTLVHVCGGAIIDSRYVLTAAHCVYELDKQELVVRSGWNKDPEHPAKEKRVFHKISKLMYLKDYRHSQCRNHEHDIAILKVARSFDLADDEHFTKVNLPEYDNDYEGHGVTFTGYGAEQIIADKSNGTSKTYKYPEELKCLITEVIPLEVCKRDAPVIVTNRNVCTRAQNHVGYSCVGDSGSPLVYEDVVVGIRNSHSSDCNRNQPEMFTRVSSYLEFINKVLNQDTAADVIYK